ncbi:MAG TPA: hypothetical protein VFG07_05585 [Thermoplasmata archaeon]|nr:hypothetical protein [Thermoplasmata archaeon]
MGETDLATPAPDPSIRNSHAGEDPSHLELAQGIRPAHATRVQQVSCGRRFVAPLGNLGGQLACDRLVVPQGNLGSRFSLELR